MVASQNCVVISYYDKRDRADLSELLKGMQKFDAGLDYRILIVVNSTGEAPLDKASFPLSDRIEIISQENIGYNIGAWETGWRHHKADSYLFLQHECRILRDGWLAAFEKKARNPRIGLVGESRSKDWGVSWNKIPFHERYFEMPNHQINGLPVRDRVKCYQHHMRSWGIDPGKSADHLQTLVLFAKRKILTTIDGFPVGTNYGEAIAAEIGISRNVVSHGYKIAEVGPQKFSWIEHPQWTENVPEPEPFGLWKRLRYRLKLYQ